MRSSYLFVSLGLLLGGINPSPAHAAGAWGVITLDSAGDTGYNPSLAIDSQGRIHIAYNDWLEGDLRYAYFNGSSWSLETVDADGLVGGTPSLDLDSSGLPHISYFDFDNEDLWHAFKNSQGQWALELVDASTRTGIYSSIEVESNGRIHIAYQDLANGDLKYATRLGGSWEITTVDSTGDVGQFASLALDAQNNPRIAYLDWGAATFDLKYAAKGASWVTEAARTDGWSGFYASLALDSNNSVHIAHQDANSEDLIYSKKANGSWTHTVVDSSGSVGEFASLALDQNQNPHIAYYDGTNKKLKHAQWTGTGWTTETLENSGVESWNTSITVDAQNNPHIAYLDWIAGDLKYARWSNAPVLSWVDEPGYRTDGVDPQSGNNFTRFSFKVQYSDPDGDPALTGMPQLVLQKSSQAISGSPFGMSDYAASGSTALYKYDAWLDGGNYNYYFQAQDRWGTPAIGLPTMSSSGPVVLGFDLPAGEDRVFVYPNPARADKMTFRIALAYLEPTIDIQIFDLSGELVRTIENEKIPKNSPPIYEYVWDLRDERSQPLASGIYVYLVKTRDKVTNSEFKVIKKLAILK